MTEQIDIAEARKEFERCRDHEDDNRTAALESIKFARLGEQWPDAIRAERERERRPILTINKLPAFIRQVVNDSRQNKPAIQVLPVDSQSDPETAEVLSGIIRNIEQTSNADVAYDTAVEQAVSSGFGYWRVSIDYAYEDSFDLDIKIDRVINQFSVYGDPNSTSADTSDWDVCFITDRIPKAVFARKYKGKAEVDFDSEGWAELDGTDWLNEDGVLIAEWWRREEVDKEIVKLSDGSVYSVEDIEAVPEIMDQISAGVLQIENRRTIKSKKVTQTIMTGAEVLETREHPGCYIPIVIVIGDEILVQGKRYYRSLVHNAMDAQRMFNYWRTLSTELIALAPRVPYIGPKGAFDEDPRWESANSASHPYLEYDGPVAPQRQPLDVGPAGGALQEALNAADDMKAVVGMYDASLGARSNETSGKAIIARQREGDVATFHFIDNLSRAIRHTGRILVDLIPKVYSGERMVRVLGEDGKAKTVPINQQYQKQMDEGGVAEQGGEADQDDAQEMQQAVMAIHDLSVGKYDVAVKSGPSFTTRREEAANQMTLMMQAFPQSAPIVGPELAKNLDWPGADEIAEKMEKLTAPPEIPPELQQQIQQGQQMITELQAENQQLKQGQEAEMQKIQMQGEVKKAEIQMQMDAKRQELVMQMEFEREKMRLELDLEREKMQAQEEMSLLKMAADSHNRSEDRASKFQQPQG